MSMWSNAATYGMHIMIIITNILIYYYWEKHYNAIMMMTFRNIWLWKLNMKIKMENQFKSKN